MLLKIAFRVLSFIRQILIPLPFPGIFRYLYRFVIVSIFLFLLLFLQLIHMLGFLLDELLFRAYRKIEINKPIFVLGVPRSGTTFVHRLLANDINFTTFSTWECFFAPSISERYFWHFIATIDCFLGKPLTRLTRWLERRAFAWIEDIHPVSLNEPEEDYLTFLPILCCFILVLPFPESEWLWRIGCFDRDLNEKEQTQLLKWYRRCLQKHIYFNGQHLTLLSKNASFAGMAQGILREFPDSTLIICERDALEVIVSQFNSLIGGMKFFGLQLDNPHFRSKMLDCLFFYYKNLDVLVNNDQVSKIIHAPLWELSNNTRRIMEKIYEEINRDITSDLDKAIKEYEQQTAQNSSYTKLPLATWGIDEEEIKQQFAAWRHKENLRL